MDTTSTVPILASPLSWSASSSQLRDCLSKDISSVSRCCCKLCTLSCLAPVEIFPWPFEWSQWPPALYNWTKWLAPLGSTAFLPSQVLLTLGHCAFCRGTLLPPPLRLLALLNFYLAVLTEGFLVNLTISFSPSHSIPQVVSHLFNCRFFIFWSHQKSLLKLLLSYAISLEHLSSHAAGLWSASAPSKSPLLPCSKWNRTSLSSSCQQGQTPRLGLLLCRTIPSLSSMQLLATALFFSSTTLPRWPAPASLLTFLSFCCRSSHTY